MKVVPFIADSAEDAVAQIRSQLGPEAVVLNVRQLPAGGLSRFWHKSRIEVLACLPDSPALDLVTPTSTGPLPFAPVPSGPESNEPAPCLLATPSGAAFPEAAVNYRSAAYARHAETTPPAPQPIPNLAAPAIDSPPLQLRDYGAWRVGELLEAGGLLPRFVQRIVDRAKSIYGNRPPENITEELQVVRQLLLQSWNPPKERPARRCRLLIGAPGTGKSTALCKWLVQSVLVEGHTARVWRLDTQIANTAESVSVFCDILRVPADRSPSDTPPLEELLFVDLPGANINDPAALGALRAQLASLPEQETLLVLNAAYEMPVLLAQVRAFGNLPIDGLVFTHLDEETRWGKLWNFVYGTNYTVRFLCSGQNVPGDFFEATAERLISRLLP
jgi:flagellar biosynthesis protein FlhF